MQTALEKLKQLDAELEATRKKYGTDRLAALAPQSVGDALLQDLRAKLGSELHLRKAKGGGGADPAAASPVRRGRVERERAERVGARRGGRKHAREQHRERGKAHHRARPGRRARRYHDFDHGPEVEVPRGPH